MALQVLVTGCATMRDSVLTGMGTGAALGAANGAALSSDNRNKGALTGALVGVAVGGIASYFIHNGLEKRDARIRRDTLFNLEKFNVSGPQGMSIDGGHGLTMPVVESQWVDTQVQGKKLVEGHRVWVISEEPQWVPAKKSKK
ncbi:MAG: hypothetical protein H6621_00120 [Halobacteriovoraceae bacterium]|nr:hypothetical protein [Halobacteriovoraceae bacterium]MCB9093445.1 hypothetical protein [Halobacteriovoraceae bacterium]